MDKSNKESIFRQVYNDNYAVVLNLINKQINNFHDSEEICHNLFIAMYNKIEEINDHRSWLRGSVRFEILTYLRKNNKSGGQISIDDLNEEITPASKSDPTDLSIILKEAIENPGNYENDKEKILFQLVAINKYTYLEAASELGITRRQVEYAYGKVVQKIMAFLVSKGISTEDFL